MRYVFVVVACCVGMVAACSVVNSPDDPEDPSGSAGGAFTTSGTGASTGTGASGPGDCADGMKNGTESDVDCGGSCDPCPTGKSCNVAGDCQSGNCPSADGVCCGSACDGFCEACASSKTGAADGTCAPILQGSDPDTECASTPASGCGVAGTGCDGSGACLLYAQGTECTPPSCINGMGTAAGLCDGTGTCVPGTSASCGDYICDPQTMACKTSCSSNADCVSPKTCNTATSACESSTVTFNTHNFMGYTEYPLDTDVCMCCSGTTSKQTADAFCVLAGKSVAVSWTTGMITGTNCYCWDCISTNSWASNCCSGQASRPMILTVTCQ